MNLHKILPYFYLSLTDETFSRLTEYIMLDDLIRLITIFVESRYIKEFANEDLKYQLRLISYLIEKDKSVFHSISFWYYLINVLTRKKMIQEATLCYRYARQSKSIDKDSLKALKTIIRKRKRSKYLMQ
ncbi:MAG: hypothetical protein V3V33_15050 [Candidatus Lokiarchaeia archaeon]